MNTNRTAQILLAVPGYQVRIAIDDALGRLPTLGCWYHRTVERSMDVVQHGVRALVACDETAYNLYVSKTIDLERICPGIEMMLGSLVSFIAARVLKEVRQVNASASFLMNSSRIKRSVLVSIHHLMSDRRIDAERPVIISFGGR